MASTAGPSSSVQIPHRETSSDNIHNHRRGGKYSNIPRPIDAMDLDVDMRLSTSTSSQSSGTPSYSSSPALGSTPRSPSRKLSSHSSTSSSPRSTFSPHTSKGKQKASDAPPTSLPSEMSIRESPLGPTMASSSSYRSINLNSPSDDPDTPPRLITYTKAAQGFCWNEELFLPSYLMSRGGRRRRGWDGGMDDDNAVEVVEIHISDDEARAMMP